MSNTISDYLEELVSQKSALAANLTTMGVSASSSEKLNTLVPKVLEIEGGEAVVQPLSVTQNGIYNPPSGVDGYAPVTVNVSGGSGSEDDPFALKNYIESSGTQYINTGYILSIDSIVELVAVDINNYSSGTNPTFFGVREVLSVDANAKGCMLFLGTSGNDVRAQFGSPASAYSIAYTNSFKNIKTKYTLQKNQLTIENENHNCYANFFTTSVAPSSVYPLFIFAYSEHGTPRSNSYNKLRLYRLRIYEGQNIGMELVPWIDSNNVVCLKDTVSGNLIYNVGTGNFVYGTDS